MKKPKKKEMKQEPESSEDEKTSPQYGLFKKKEAVVDEKKVTGTKEGPQYTLFKKAPETTIILAEDIFKMEDDEEKRTFEARLEIYNYLTNIASVLN